MKIILLLKIVLLISIVQLKAQHCKFDGLSILVIKLVDKKGKTKSISDYSILIKGGDKFKNDEDTIACCSLSSSLIFDSLSKVLLNTDDKVWNSYAKKYEGLPLFKYKNCYAVILTDAQLECLTGNCNTNKNIFVQYTHKRFKTVRYSYPAKKDVYPLCSSHGKWQNIKPVIILLPSKEVFYGH
jgi:hypothetical protein